MKHPSWIPEQVVGAPIEFKWSGASDHVGPMETVTPLLNMLSGKTTCGQVSLIAGLLQWAAWRLNGHTDSEHNLWLAEAAFAYQVDWRYCDVDAGREPVDQPPAQSAMMLVNSFARQALDYDEFWNSYYQPVRLVFHAAHVVQHILPKSERAVFEGWLKSTVARLDLVAPKPEEAFKKKKEFASAEEHAAFISRHRGVPLPPEVLDPSFEYEDSARAELVSKFLSSVNWDANPYLRSPDAMIELGFVGKPYQLA
jgi:hypothetical protein